MMHEETMDRERETDNPTHSLLDTLGDVVTIGMNWFMDGGFILIIGAMIALLIMTSVYQEIRDPTPAEQHAMQQKAGSFLRTLGLTPAGAILCERSRCLVALDHQTVFRFTCPLHGVCEAE
jgi:hypothetical protein